MDKTDMRTFGDVRRYIINTIVALRSGEISATDAMACAAHFKVLNDNIQVEINAAKLSLLAEERGHSFGRVVGMGTRLIGNESTSDER